VTIVQNYLLENDAAETYTVPVSDDLNIMIYVINTEVGFICYEVKAATLKSCAGLPSTSSGASLDFASTSHASLLGVVCIKRKSFYHLIEPFVLDTRPGLLFGFFAGIYCRLKSGQSI
jgi:hypothetical protein